MIPTEDRVLRWTLALSLAAYAVCLVLVKGGGHP